MVYKQLCCAGDLRIFCCGNGNIPMLTDIKGFADNVVSGIIRDQ